MRLGVAAAILWGVIGLAGAEPVPVRVVAANLTSGNYQSYSPDNGNHSNPEGAGARILAGLRPDVVLVQEFNTSVPARQWVNATFGEGFAFFIESGGGIPNGIVSRFPIVESGEWDDPTQTNRDFAWAKIALPNGKFLWAISVHLYARKAEGRLEQARVLAERIRAKIPAGDLVVLGGDFNTRGRDEACVRALAEVLEIPTEPPADAAGNAATNAPRKLAYDWVLADADLQRCETPVRLGGADFRHGIVFDSRVFRPLADVAPAQPGDSAVPGMQHMAVARDFLVP